MLKAKTVETFENKVLLSFVVLFHSKLATVPFKKGGDALTLSERRSAIVK